MEDSNEVNIAIQMFTLSQEQQVKCGGIIQETGAMKTMKMIARPEDSELL